MKRQAQLAAEILSATCLQRCLGEPIGIIETAALMLGLSLQKAREHHIVRVALAAYYDDRVLPSVPSYLMYADAQSLLLSGR